MAVLNLFTSESVTEGHPDKLADQISDAVLDEMLKQDPHSHVALETFLTRGLAVVGGEVTTEAYVEIADVVRTAINEVGYTSTAYGFDGDTTGVMLAIQKQSPDINQGVERGSIEEQGAGDQGMMFGYACNETESFMPLPITMAHRLTAKYTEIRKANPSLGLRPDGKSQVTIAYDKGIPQYVETIVFSAQHDEALSQEDVADLVSQHVISPVMKEFASFDKGNIRYHINPTGKFVIGGPQGDTGVTGRKIIVDTYGGYARHGGGAFSGKDPSKVDRSASYMARYVAKNVVAAGLADKCEIQLAYAIGVAKPVSVFVETFGTNKIPSAEISERISKAVDLRPGPIIKRLSLLDATKISYRLTAKNGHFGNPTFPWEAMDLVDALKG